MTLIAVVCGLAGLLLGMIANVRALALVAVLMLPAAFFSGASGDSLAAGVLWAITGLVTLQVGYILAVVIRATWFAEARDVRQSVQSP